MDMGPIRFSEDARIDRSSATSCASRWDDLEREVYCVLGIPIDAIDMLYLVHAIENAAAHKTPFLISTPNLNFLVNSHRDREFRETLLLSELCPADGMPIVWIARLLGLPIYRRVAGSDLLAALRSHRSTGRLSLFLFGGTEGVAEAAAKTMNKRPGRLTCVGSIYPGFGSVEEMSLDGIIKQINASGADFLIVALGAIKGQIWLQRNHSQLHVPVRAHLGATLNFETGRVRRAPPLVRKLGLEWLWRIKEEPHLWRRYWTDGITLLRLLFFRIFPLAIRERWSRLTAGTRHLVIERREDPGMTTLSLVGAATACNVSRAVAIFRDAVGTKKKICINLADTSVIDARFLGLLLMLRKQAKKLGSDVIFFGASSRLRTSFRLNEVEFLLAPDHPGGGG